MKRTAQKSGNGLAIRRVYRLEDLLKRITPRNLHDKLDFGWPAGRETM